VFLMLSVTIIFTFLIIIIIIAVYRDFTRSTSKLLGFLSFLELKKNAVSIRKDSYRLYE